MAHKITIYNHKGGVGKTTLTVNIASAMAEQKRCVLLVDSDPQCNLTSYLLGEDVVDDLLDNSDRDNGGTLWTAVKPVLNNTGAIWPIKAIETGIPNVFLLPGDIRLSEFEQFLGDAWPDCFRRRIGAIAATSSISTLVESVSELKNIDYVFFDAGPNIGPLNRALLLDTDSFIVPVACDLFSMRALSTLGASLCTWIDEWATIVSLAPDDVRLLHGKPRFLGYIPQRFRVYGQQMAKAPANYLRSIERRVHSDVVARLRSLDQQLASPTAVRLGEVKDFGSIVQLAQRQGVPISGVQGANEQQKAEAWQTFQGIAKNILNVLEGSRPQR